MVYCKSISYVIFAIILLCKLSSTIHHAFVLPIVHISSTDNNIIQYKQSISAIPVSACYLSGSGDQDQEDDISNITNNNTNTQLNEEKDTIRVRIWKALASSKGDEISLTQLCKLIGVRNKGDVRSHLIHVERQAKTIQNKSNEWRVRRGLLPLDDTNNSQDGSAKGRVGGAKKVKIKRRRGAKNEEFIRLVF